MKHTRIAVATLAMLLAAVGIGTAHDPNPLSLDVVPEATAAAYPQPPILISLPYSTLTSSTDGIAHCVVQLTVKAIRGTPYDVTTSVTPTAGEAVVDSASTILDGPIAGGLEPACDIFPDGPADGTTSQLAPTGSKFVQTQTFLLDMYVHSHPDQAPFPPGVCGVGIEAAGTLDFKLQKTGRGWILKRLLKAQILSCEPVSFEDVPGNLLRAQ